VRYPEGMDGDLRSLLEGILVNDPQKRIDIKQVIKHKFFANKEDLSGSLKRAPSSRMIPTLPTVPSINIDQKATARMNHAIHFINNQ
jgi:serine/threonine protein kinase